MDIRKLQRAIVDGLEDVKAQNIVVFNTEHLSPLFERVIIASGTSNRQTKALASSVRDAVKARGLAAPRTEGEENGEWIIVDCGAAVVHVMQPAIREYYHLEEIWGGKAVKMKIDTSPLKLVKAEVEPPKARPRSTAARPAGTARAAPAKAPTKAPAAKKAAAKRPAAKRPAAKTAVAGKTATRVAAAPRGAAGRPARPAPAKKATATRASRPAPAKKAARTTRPAPAATRKPAAKKSKPRA